MTSAQTVAGVGWALSAAAGWGASGFLAGLAARRMAVLKIVMIGQLAGFVGALLLGAGRGGLNGLGDGRMVAWAAAAGILETVGLILIYRATVAAAFGAVSPFVAVGVAVPVLTGTLQGQAPPPAGWAGLGLVAVGVLVIARERGSTAATAPLRPALALAALAGGLFGLATVCIAHAAVRDSVSTGLVSKITAVVALSAIGAIGLLRRRRIPHPSENGWPPSSSHPNVAARPQPVIFAIIAGLADVGGNIAFGVGSTRISLPLVATLSALDPVVTVMLARLVLGERLPGAQRWGAGAALVGACLSALG